MKQTGPGQIVRSETGLLHKLHMWAYVGRAFRHKTLNPLVEQLYRIRGKLGRRKEDVQTPEGGFDQRG